MTDSNATELCFSDGCRDPEVTGGWPDEFDGDATLLPCPFCGGEATLWHNKTWDYEVRCTKCRVKTRQHHENENGAVDDWNTRTPEQAVAATLWSGTCSMEYGGDVTDSTKRVLGVYFCSECGSPTYNDCMPYYCMYCGKAVKR